MDECGIVESFEMNEITGSDEPSVFIFDDSTEDEYNKAINILKSKKYELLDINQYIRIAEEDYSISVAEAGLRDQGNNYTINDLVCEKKKKDKWIYKVKLNRLKNIVNNNTVLLVRYDNMFIENNYVYETIRRWLKDGYLFDGQYSDICLNALVFAETDEKIMDFCRYGERI